MYTTGLNILKHLSLVKHQKNVQMSLFNKKKSEDELYLCICIERHQIIKSQLDNLEKNLCSTLLEVDTESSNKSNFELERNNNLTKLGLMNKRNIEFNSSNSIKLSAKDLQEYSQNQFSNLEISPKISDKTKNCSKTRLQQSLFFVTKKLIESEKESWILPKDVIRNGETIKQAAGRILNYNCGDNCTISFYGNIPIAYSKYDNIIDHREQKKIRCYKTFYLLAKYINGDFPNNSKYQWLNMQELQQILPKSVYMQLYHVFHISQ